MEEIQKWVDGYFYTEIISKKVIDLEWILKLKDFNKDQVVW